VIDPPPPLAVTVRVVEPETEPDVAPIVVEPVPRLVASPLLPVVLLIVATPVAEELHVTDVVKFWVVPSLKVPVAVNCCVAPVTIEGFAGVTASDVSVAGATVTVAVVLPPSVAVRVTVWLVATDPAVAVKVAEDVVAATGTDAGTGSALGLFEDNVTVLPPVGAA
jgi:hypothetical protein